MGRYANLRTAGVLAALLVVLFGCAACSGPAPGASPSESPAQTETRTEDAHPKEVAQPAETGEPVQTPVDPASFAPTVSVSAKDVERAGGVDKFFWVEEISDAVFARMDGNSYGPSCTVPLDDLRYVRTL